ncbi:MAG: Maf family protein [Gammaproteobacteria bacterium]
MPVPTIYLASESPRRRELLAIMGVDFTVMPANIDETPLPGELPDVYVRRMAIEKTRAVRAGLAMTEDTLVLGADTAVVLDDAMLGKPQGRESAMAMLTALSGQTHVVLSGVALSAVDRDEVVVSRTEVCFRPIKTAEMAAYWETGEPADKAGAYGIQGLGGVFVRWIKGSYSGVVGLPVYETAELLGRFGCSLPDDRRNI